MVELYLYLQIVYVHESADVLQIFPLVYRLCTYTNLKIFCKISSLAGNIPGFMGEPVGKGSQSFHGNGHCCMSPACAVRQGGLI
jgi:hypothetical protein